MQKNRKMTELDKLEQRSRELILLMFKSKIELESIYDSGDKENLFVHEACSYCEMMLEKSKVDGKILEIKISEVLSD